MALHTDQILTDATLRGVKHISWNKKQLELREAIDQLKAISQQFGVGKGNQTTLKELETLQQKMNQQTIEWITEVGYHAHRDYVITILIEEAA